MKTLLCRGSVSLLVALIFSTLIEAAAPPPGEVEKKIGELGAESFDQRTKAEAWFKRFDTRKTESELKSARVTVLRKLLAALTNKDPEIVLRAKNALRSLGYPFDLPLRKLVGKFTRLTVFGPISLNIDEKETRLKSYIVNGTVISGGYGGADSGSKEPHCRLSVGRTLATPAGELIPSGSAIGSFAESSPGGISFSLSEPHKDNLGSFSAFTCYDDVRDAQDMTLGELSAIWGHRILVEIVD